VVDALGERDGVRDGFAAAADLLAEATGAELARVESVPAEEGAGGALAVGERVPAREGTVAPAVGLAREDGERESVAAAVAVRVEDRDFVRVAPAEEVTDALRERVDVATPDELAEALGRRVGVAADDAADDDEGKSVTVRAPETLGEKVAEAEDVAEAVAVCDALDNSDARALKESELDRDADSESRGDKLGGCVVDGGGDALKMLDGDAASVAEVAALSEYISDKDERTLCEFMFDSDEIIEPLGDELSERVAVVRGDELESPDGESPDVADGGALHDAASDAVARMLDESRLDEDATSEPLGEELKV
jgi:hypothetical protein